MFGSFDIAQGTQYGDEGKGKIIKKLCQKISDSGDRLYSYLGKYNGGANAGHSDFDLDIAFHLIPAGITIPGLTCVIGNGVVADPHDIYSEIKALKDKEINITPDNLKISHNLFVTMPYHKTLDFLEDFIKERGTTGKGIGPTYSSAIARDGFRLVDFFDKYKVQAYLKKNQGIINNSIEYLLGVDLPMRQEVKRERYVKDNLNKYYDAEKGINIEAIIETMHAAVMQLQDHLTDTSRLLNDALKKGENVLAEGAQAGGLDVTFGSYPYVTSSHTGTAGAIDGLGVNPRYLGDVIGVVKLAPSRVGEGPFRSEHGIYNDIRSKTRQELGLNPSELEILRIKINEGRVTPAEIGQYFRNLGVNAEKTSGGEYGATTGRPRRVGWLDLPMVAKYVELNGINKLAVTKLDAYSGIDSFQVLVEESDIGEEFYAKMQGFGSLDNIETFEDLPKEAKTLLSTVEKYAGAPIKFISKGPKDRDMIEID